MPGNTVIHTLADEIHTINETWRADFARFSGGAAPGEGDVIEKFQSEYDQTKDDAGWNLVEMLDSLDSALQSTLDEKPYELCERAYDKHADECTVCCLLGGEFCAIGLHLQDVLELLESAPKTS